MATSTSSTGTQILVDILKILVDWNHDVGLSVGFLETSLCHININFGRHNKLYISLTIHSPPIFRWHANMTWMLFRVQSKIQTPWMNKKQKLSKNSKRAICYHFCITHLLGRCLLLPFFRSIFGWWKFIRTALAQFEWIPHERHRKWCFSDVQPIINFNWIYIYKKEKGRSSSPFALCWSLLKINSHIS